MVELPIKRPGMLKHLEHKEQFHLRKIYHLVDLLYRTRWWRFARRAKTQATIRQHLKELERIDDMKVSWAMARIRGVE